MSARVLVCGGRDYADRENVFASLDTFRGLHGCDLLIHGGASGADTLAGEWAASRGITTEVYFADWHTHGRAAGPMRNQRMIDEGRPTHLVAFPGGRGTADMERRAERAEIHRYNG